LHEKRIDICERLNAPYDCALETFKGVGLREMHSRLDGGQQVLSPVLRLASENSDLCLAPFLLGDVARDLGSPDDFPAYIPHG
jgi:hypothetical protein